MKKIILLLTLILSFILVEAQTKYYQPTKHKTIKRMTQKQVRQAKVGRTLYERHGDSVKKNRTTPLPEIKPRKHYREYWVVRTEKRNKKRL